MSDSKAKSMLGLLGVLAVVWWAGPAQAVKPTPSGKQAGKFVVLGTGEVWDTTTSLRWQQTPGAPADTVVSDCENGAGCTWFEAWDYCEALGDGSRLAGVKELQSLVDYSVPGPTLPEGHPFVDENGDSTVKPAIYWSASTLAVNAARAWGVRFDDGVVLDVNKGIGAFVFFHAWCVRGNQAFAGQNIMPPAP